MGEIPGVVSSVYSYSSPVAVTDPSGKQEIPNKTLNVVCNSNIVDQIVLAMIVHFITGGVGFEAIDRESSEAGVEIITGSISGTDYQGMREGTVAAGSTSIEVSANATPIGPGVERGPLGRDEGRLRDLAYPGREVNLHKVTIRLNTEVIAAKARGLANRGIGSEQSNFLIIAAGVLSHEIQHGLEAIRDINGFLSRAVNDWGVPHSERSNEECPNNVSDAVDLEMSSGMNQ